MGEGGWLRARILDIVRECFRDIADGRVEVYNEAGLQHELGFRLRQQLSPTYRVELERNVSHFGLEKRVFEKKEIDIVAYTPDKDTRHAIELKVPMNGMVPEQIFSSCKDIRFLEQLVGSGGFQESHFVFVANDAQFFHGKSDGIYGHFRAGVPIAGKIQKPTGARDAILEFARSHHLAWEPLGRGFQGAIVTVAP